MNEQVRYSQGHRTTQAAEGLPRWRWTIAELVRLADLGAFTAEDRIELIGGEIVPMSPAGRRHEVVREALEHILRKHETSDVRVFPEPQLNLDDDTHTKPDVLVRPASIATFDVRGPTALLVIEVAATSIEYDLRVKAPLYARFGVREYWVVDTATLSVWAHLEPGPDGYAAVSEHPSSELLTPHLAPALAVRLAELDLD